MPPRKAQSLAQTYDLSRSEIIETLRLRLQKNSRAKLTSKERSLLTLMFKDKLVEMAQSGTDTRDAIERLCKAEITLLEEAYPASSINSYYLPKYTKVIRDAIAAKEIPLNYQNSYERQWNKQDGSGTGVERRHHALDFLVYDYQTQIKLRGITTKHNNTRQDNMKPVNLDRYMEKVQELLQSNDTLELIVGIAAATGRRHTEVVSLGQFKLQDHPYLLTFSGQQKKADAIEFDILTLLPAVDVLAALNRLREKPEMIEIEGKPSEHPNVRRINAWVNRGVHRLLGDTQIVPVLEGFKTVSIHRLRGLYGAIAIHYFCPEHKREHRFLQYYLGHVLEGEIAPNSRATDHYFHYYLVRGKKSIRARGVKVPSSGLLPALQQNFEEKAHATQAQPSPVKAAALKSPDVDRDTSAIAPLQTAETAEIDQSDEADEADEADVEPTAKTSFSDKDDDMINQQLVDTLQRIAGQQSQTVETQARVIAEQHERIRMLETQVKASSLPSNDAAAPPTVVEASGDTARYKAQISALKQQLQESTDEKKKLHAKAEAYRTQWQETLESLNSIRKALNMPELSPDEAKPPKKSEKDASPAAARRQETRPSQSEESGHQASPYKRAEKIWALTKQWNQAHPERAILINQSILNSKGIHRDAAVSFLEDYREEVNQENQRIGVTAKNERTFNRGKLSAYKAFLDGQAE
ncbi:MAG: hypothetical protein F6J95_025440 [Leptolyngbya sp. SIO1E4]|nr:hypothetical protein [Leptolyngbya sp. SIO1E4]